MRAMRSGEMVLILWNLKKEGKGRSIVVCAFKIKDYQTPKERGPGPLMATDDP